MEDDELINLDALIFIDTNIFLDFYRIRKSDISMKYLRQIEEHKDIIITTDQVEMEFKKNRQRVILESLGEVKKIGSTNVSVPAILSKTKALDMIIKSKNKILEDQKKLKKRIEHILEKPNSYDPVYISLQRLFKHESDFCLNRKNNIRYKIRKLALKRFVLGYPPRKSSDNSIGDSVNWEWIINCATNSKKHIILVTRDTDFGIIHEGQSFLNDWLNQEFKDRISRRRKLILTDKLSTAFKIVKIPVTDEMIKEEEEIISSSWSSFYQSRLNDVLEKYKYEDLSQTIRKLQESYARNLDKFKSSDDNETDN